MQIRIPATSANLGPGFDCIGMALNLYNYIEFETNDDNKVHIEVDGLGAENLKKDESNLIYFAFKKAFAKAGKPVPGVKFVFTNNIPLARGLGSSSAAIIGGLVAANYLLENQLSIQDVLELAVEIEGHPDNVAPALLGGLVLCTSADNKVLYKKIQPPGSLSCSLIVPKFELSTKKSRDALPKQIPLQDAVFNISRMAFFVNAMLTGDLSMLKTAMEDKLHQPYRSVLIPGLKELLLKVNEIDVLGAAISGAGPSILVFHEKNKNKDINLLVDILKEHGTRAELYNLEPVSEGAEIL
ncbi:MAG: homoserine kinase [Bacillota bacterium]